MSNGDDISNAFCLNIVGGLEAASAYDVGGKNTTTYIISAYHEHLWSNSVK